MLLIEARTVGKKELLIIMSNAATFKATLINNSFSQWVKCLCEMLLWSLGRQSGRPGMQPFVSALPVVLHVSCPVFLDVKESDRLSQMESRQESEMNDANIDQNLLTPATLL